MTTRRGAARRVGMLTAATVAVTLAAGCGGSVGGSAPRPGSRGSESASAATGSAVGTGGPSGVSGGATSSRTATGSAAPAGDGRFAPVFGADGLVTNELASREPHLAGVHLSDDWTVTSGSLFASGGAGWTGVPDGSSPDAASADATGSAVFRLVSRRRDFGDTVVALRLKIVGLTTTDRTPEQTYDGVHVWLRYQSYDDLYALSVSRRDGEVVLKRKLAGGPDPVDGGTYTTLGSGKAPFPLGTWVDVRATVHNVPGGAVRVTLEVAGKKVLDVTDPHPGDLVRPGGVGLRGDNAEFYFADFAATPS